MKIFDTDYYQFTMSLAYLVADKANETTGFESFVRHIKPKVNTSGDFYIFSGENEVENFIKSVKEEIKDSTFFDKFWQIVKGSIEEDRQAEIYTKAKVNFDKMKKDFDYTVMEEGTVLRPYVPVFQYKGPKMFGQMIETRITNIVNGRTGYATYKSQGDFYEADIGSVTEIMNGEDTEAYRDYIAAVTNTAIEYRKATTRLLFEAAFRRSPNSVIANLASKIAVDNGWNGTSNVAAYQIEMVRLKDLGGSMAHAFVMSFETEIEAFRAWDNVFPNSTFLVDTYDTIACIKMLIEEDLKPARVRIDSGDLKALSYEVRSILDAAGWNDVKIFISGDITPEMLREYEAENVPFDLTMAGTKYVNIFEMEQMNAGFVYKIVEYTKDRKTFYPEKKAEGKTNYPGLKKITINPEGELIMEIGQKTFGYPSDMSKVVAETKVIFREGY